jgi:hypothetical protein
MLPGIRFLLAAIVLSVSILTFGLGAAALLRAAHEEVASVPTRRVMPEPVFAQQMEAPLPTLALLRLEPATQEKAPDATSAPIAAPEPAPEAAPAPEVEAERLAALKADDIAPTEEAAAKPEAAVVEAPAPQPAAESPPAAEAKLAALDAAPSPLGETTLAPFDQIAASVLTDANEAITKTAALGSSVAKVESPAEAKQASEQPDRAEIRKKRRAERARERRRLAARRARLAAQQAAAQQALNPFAQMVQQAQPATTATATTSRQ